MSVKQLNKAVAYLRTSSSANVGADKDSERRQLEAINAYAASAGFEIVETYYDAAVSGADPVDQRPGFAAMMERIASNGVRTIIVETASRFARDLIVQETGYRLLCQAGVALIASDSPEGFLADTPTAVLIRQILGAVSEFDKAMTVAKLKGARDRKRATGVKVEGRKSYSETNPEMVALAKKLHRYPINGRRRSLREVAAELARQGFTNGKGEPLTATAVKRMIEA